MMMISKKKYDNLYFILLNGKAGVGKDYIANKLSSALHMPYLNFDCVLSIAYGDYLRNELRELLSDINAGTYTKEISKRYNLPHYAVFALKMENYKQPFDLSVSHKDPRYRKLMQFYGTNVRRAQDDSYWVDKLVNNINLYDLDLSTFTSKKQNVVIIPDVRFMNEYTVPKNTFKHVAFYQITDSTSAIDKREQTRDTKAMTDEEKQHISEHDLDNFKDFDHVFDRSKCSTEEIVNHILSDLLFSRFDAVKSHPPVFTFSHKKSHTEPYMDK